MERPQITGAVPGLIFGAPLLYFIFFSLTDMTRKNISELCGSQQSVIGNLEGKKSDE